MMLAVGSADIVGAYGPNRTIAIYNIHTKETLRVLYRKDGRYIPSAMKQIDWVMRDWRRDVATTMDPKLIDLLWEIHAELGSKEPIHVISGFRSQKTNNMLRRSRGGQAKRSRHIIGSAADVRFPDVPIKRIRYSALIRERGGVGYYPTSATPFVHIDTGRVRHWPRMRRYELALLFPRGRTKHRPRDGGSISLRDVRAAKAARPALAKRLAAYHASRQPARRTLLASSSRKPGTTLRASLTPKLVAPPRRVTRSPTQLAMLPRNDRTNVPRLVSGPTLLHHPTNKAHLVSTSLPAEPPPAALKMPFDSAPASTLGSGWQARIASLPKAAARPTLDAHEPAYRVPPVDPRPARFAPAPAYDDEHPEELSYRPFPIVPLLGRSANVDDPKLVLLRHPDFSKTYQMIGQPASKMPMRFRPNLKDARRLWAAQFSGDAASVASLLPARIAPPTRRATNHHKVQTVRQ